MIESSPRSPASQKGEQEHFDASETKHRMGSHDAIERTINDRT